MTTLSRAAAVAMIGALLATQAGCVTSALLKMGEGSSVATPRTEQPVAYTGAARDGRNIELTYNTTIDSDGNLHSNSPSHVRVDLGSVYWRGIGAAPMDPYCARETWLRLLPNAPPQPPAPLILNRPNDYQTVIGLHKQHATGFPPLTVQAAGLDTWIVCGVGDAIGYAEAPTPPPPNPGSTGERSAGYIVAIVILFPFALAVDIAGAVFYAAVCISGSKC